MELSRSQAEAIYAWRLNGCSWRRVADHFNTIFPEDAERMEILPGNQIDGRELLNIALNVLDQEDPYE